MAIWWLWPETRANLDVNVDSKNYKPKSAYGSAPYFHPTTVFQFHSFPLPILPYSIQPSLTYYPIPINTFDGLLLTYLPLQDRDIKLPPL